ncbi:hypothetical protein QFZ24_007164 [Streptomyces phaeochromogenes]|uniref:hypothetical protein n=1 Tax=Streptomyces phaeochromogenes TaxID=1923 RepID=UPI002791418E|nr:hypothetical protein [Streptomyces phaeochromogenes]MDQ0953241.1 hypothetical protein [Streptomyces phaeochromogenes]
MRTGGPSWRGPVLALVLVTGALAAGCGESGPRGGAASTRAASGTPSATPPEDLCARIVAHWSREVLDSDTYGDYQSMGLSNGQYEILMDVVDTARAEKKRSGEQAARELIDRGARERCTERYRDGDPTGGPWS